MGKHAKDKCVICGSQDEVTFITWYKNPDNTKGAWFCKTHESKEVKNYTWGK